jgi:hypothetical protein
MKIQKQLPASFLLNTEAKKLLRKMASIEQRSMSKELERIILETAKNRQVTVDESDMQPA